MEEITITIKDSRGFVFSRSWKSTADKIDAIRWTIESEDVPYYLEVSEIVEITVDLSTVCPNKLTQKSEEER